MYDYVCTRYSKVHTVCTTYERHLRRETPAADDSWKKIYIARAVSLPPAQGQSAKCLAPDSLWYLTCVEPTYTNPETRHSAGCPKALSSRNDLILSAFLTPPTSQRHRISHFLENRDLEK
jgi:hypothetical protein